MKVELDFDLSEDKLRELWCMMANARVGQKQALIKIMQISNTDLEPRDCGQNIEAFIYYSAALGAYVDVLGLAAPDNLRPDGSETQKP